MKFFNRKEAPSNFCRLTKLLGAASEGIVD